MKIRECDLSENIAALYDAIGEENFIKVVKLYGGNNLYIPTYKSVIRYSRDREIIRRYNGVNATMLSREYGISVTQVRTILKERGYSSLFYFIRIIFCESSLILSVRPVSFPSILINKYIDIAIGNPTLAMRVCKLASIDYILY